MHKPVFHSRATSARGKGRYRGASNPTESFVSYALGAVIVGAVAGLGSLALTPEGRADVSQRTGAAAVTLGLARARPPIAGDYWQGCDPARAAGTAPIYAGEPGYRPQLDGDADGIACEPYPGMPD